MNNAEALAKIQDAASARPARVDMSLQHAIQRRKGRNIQRQDVLYCLTTANNCAPDTIPGRWKVCGEDLDGDTLTLIVTIEEVLRGADRVVLITGFE